LLNGLERFQNTRAGVLADSIAALVNPLPYLLLAAVVVVIAASSRGLRGAAAVVFVLAAANITTQHLKPTLAAPRDSLQVDAASWPSGHSTAAMALALCAVIAAPSIGRRAVAAAGALLALAVGVSVVLLGWHYPSDALGGFLIASSFACLAVAGLELSSGPPGCQSGSRRRWRPARG